MTVEAINSPVDTESKIVHKDPELQKMHTDLEALGFDNSSSSIFSYYNEKLGVLLKMTPTNGKEMSFTMSYVASGDRPQLQRMHFNEVSYFVAQRISRVPEVKAKVDGQREEVKEVLES